MTKKMTTSNINMTGASGEKAAVSDFDSSLPFQPGGNTAGALTLRAVFPKYKDPASIQDLCTVENRTQCQGSGRVANRLKRK